MALEILVRGRGKTARFAYNDGWWFDIVRVICVNSFSSQRQVPFKGEVEQIAWVGSAGSTRRACWIDRSGLIGIESSPWTRNEADRSASWLLGSGQVEENEAKNRIRNVRTGGESRCVDTRARFLAQLAYFSARNYRAITPSLVLKMNT